RLERQFGRNDGRGACLTTGDGAQIRSDVVAFVDTVAAAVRPAASPDAPCPASKLRAIASKFLALMKAEARNVRNPDAGLLVDARTSAEAAFVAAFDAANALAGCEQGDEAEKERESRRVDNSTRKFIGRLVPTCGDNVRAPAEECDGLDDGACPGVC